VRRPLVLVLTPFLVGATPSLEWARADGANIQAPCWSLDGKQLSYEANYHDRKVIELYVGDGTTFRRVTPSSRVSTGLTAGFSTRASSGGVAHELTWAPPSVGRFLYAASSDRFDYDLYLSEGGPVAKSPGADGGAAWSPDGRYIAFTSARTGEGDIYLIDVSEIEKPPRQLTMPRTSSELHVNWAPTSDALVFVGHSRTGDNVWLLPDLDSAPVQLTTWRGNQIHPRYSPVNATVAFYANHDDPNRFDLYVMAASAGSEAKRLVKGVVVNERGPAWTPDGKHVLVVVDDNDAFDPIVAVDVQTASVRRLSLDTVGHGDLDVTARDGVFWLAYVAQGRSTDAVRDFKRLFASPIEGLP
jgi:Tol biopolymer transport system component